jgi:RimJ/RimL family protein N-acetyltransferase
MFARTERLLLRPGWAEDTDALYQAIADEQIVRNLSRAPWPYARENAEAFISRSRAPHEAVFLLFHVGAPPQLIGGMGLHPTEDGEVELGYWLAREAWGRGYATEAGRAAVAIARDALRLPKLVAGHFLDNPASGRVLRKLGFQPTGRIAMRHCVARGADIASAEFVLELNREADFGDEAVACSVAA